TIVGNFDPVEVHKNVKPIFLKFTKCETCIPPIYAASFSMPLDNVTVTEIELPENVQNGYIALGYRFPKTANDAVKRAANSVFFQLLFNWSKSGILKNETVGKNLADDILVSSFNNSPFANYIYVLLKVPAKKINDCRDAIKGFLSSVNQLKIDVKEIERAAKSFQSQMVLFERTTDHARMLTMFKAWGLTLDDEALEKNFLKIREILKPEDVTKAIEENFKNYLMVIGRPQKNK
ncbi:MAG: insulinase family protein, partial [Candidatus Riflebacteria bacterium]|nr:insulinase family protein [Candidatus Riflebacteria bacterium]